jgi:hypothetical protein
MVDKLEEILGTRHIVFTLTLSSALKTTIITLTLSLKKIAPREI